MLLFNILLRNPFRSVLLLILFCTNLFGQKSETGNWLIYFGNQKINSKLNLHTEVQYRSFDFITDTNQLILRTGLGYNLSDNNNTILLGYGFINTKKYVPNSDEKVSIDEHRIFQQFITRQNFGSVFIQHRYRIEERFLPNDFQIRFRYFLGLNIPINKKTMEKNAVYLSSYNELFINTNSPIFDRNRLYGAVGYVLNKNLKMEIGFMSQSLEKTNRNQLQIVFFNNLPF